MTPLEIIFAIITSIGTVAAVVVAIIALRQRSRVDVSFSGIPVDKKEFDKHVDEDHREQANLHSRLGGVERGVEARLNARINLVESSGNESRRILHAEVKEIGQNLAAVAAVNEANTQTLVRLDGKMDRLIERNNS